MFEVEVGEQKNDILLATKKKKKQILAITKRMVNNSREHA